MPVVTIANGYPEREVEIPAMSGRRDQPPVEQSSAHGFCGSAWRRQEYEGGT